MQTNQEIPYDSVDPYPWYRYMRQTQPVFYNEQMQLWYVFRYEDIQQVFADPKTFSSGGLDVGAYLDASFIRMDPPYHHKYRSLVSQAFTPRRVAQLEPRITAIVHQLLDAVASSGQMDLIGDLAYPLPATVIAELFGVPLTDLEHFKYLSALLIEEQVLRMTGQITGAGMVSQAKLAAYLLPLIEQRRREPGDDLISSLLAAEVDGEQLSTYDIQATSVLMLVAAHETTTRLIGNAIYCFTERPEVMEELRAHPELMPGAIEEVLRYCPPISGLARMTAVDTHIGTTAVKAGQPLILQFSSANRDETIFDDPDRFDIQRTPNRHLGFGHGIHFCLGAPLARLESTIALNIMLDRFPDLQRHPDHPVQLELGLGGLLQGLEHFPIVLTPHTL